MINATTALFLLNYDSILFVLASTREQCRFPSISVSDRITSGMRYFDLYSSEQATIRERNIMATLCGKVEKLLSFQPRERDLLMLQHKFGVEWENVQKVTDPPKSDKLSGKWQ